MLRLVTGSNPPSPLGAKRSGPSLGARHSFSLSLRRALAALLDDASAKLRGQGPSTAPNSSESPLEPPSEVSLRADISYFDPLEAVKREKEDELRAVRGLAKQDVDALMKEWMAIQRGEGGEEGAPAH